MMSLIPVQQDYPQDGAAGSYPPGDAMQYMFPPYSPYPGGPMFGYEYQMFLMAAAQQQQQGGGGRGPPLPLGGMYYPSQMYGYPPSPLLSPFGFPPMGTSSGHLVQQQYATVGVPPPPPPPPPPHLNGINGGTPPRAAGSPSQGPMGTPVSGRSGIKRTNNNAKITVRELCLGHSKGFLLQYCRMKSVLSMIVLT